MGVCETVKAGRYHGKYLGMKKFWIAPEHSGAFFTQGIQEPFSQSERDFHDPEHF